MRNALDESADRIVSWAADNNAPDTQKSLAVSIVPAIGTLGSLVATWSYRSTDAPNYVRLPFTPPR